MQRKMLSIAVAAWGVAAVRHVSREQPPTTTTITTTTTTQFWTDQLIVVETYWGEVKLQGESGDWDLANWQPFMERSRRVHGLDVSPDGSKITAGFGRSIVNATHNVIIWNASSREAHVLGGDTHIGGDPPCTKFFPDGQKIATADTRFRIWNADTNAHIRDSADLGGGIADLAVFPDNIHVAGGTQGKWVLFNTWSGALHSWAEPGFVVCLDVFPDGERVATGNTDGILRIWTVSTGTSRNLEGHNSTSVIMSLKVFSNGNKIVSGSTDTTAIVWDVATASQLVRLDGHRRGITGIDLFQNENALATASGDSSIKIWNTATWALVKTVTDTAAAPMLVRIVIFRDPMSQPNLQHNCAVGAENTWPADKKAWCCRVDHRGCPPIAPAAADV